MRRLTIGLLLSLIACSGKPGPKDVVFDFIEAVMTSDSLSVVTYLDIESYVLARMPQMSAEDSAEFLTEYGEKTISSLLGDGATRANWLKSQIIVNEATVTDSLAEVEVSFIDRITRHMVYTKMLLKRQPDKSWRIVYFRE